MTILEARMIVPHRALALGVAVALALLPRPALPKEIPIGDTKRVTEAGLDVAAVYLQPIEMEPAAHQGTPLYLPRAQADIHLEADIRAVKFNKLGYREGDWVPALTVRFRLRNLDSGAEQSGVLHPMVANDGAHYGANIKMPGLGNYQLTYIVEPPDRDRAAAHVRQGFGNASGFSWWKPFQVEWTFKYLGPGKKGGY